MTLLLWLKYGLYVDVLDTKKIMYVCVHTHLVVERHSLLETAGLCEHGGIALSTTAISFFVLSCIQNVHQSSMCQNLLYAIFFLVLTPNGGILLYLKKNVNYFLFIFLIFCNVCICGTYILII